MHKGHAWECANCKAIVKEVTKRRFPKCPRCGGTEWSGMRTIYTMTPYELAQCRQQSN